MYNCRMKVSDVGEFGLIEVMANIIDPKRKKGAQWPGLLLSIGDDAAVWRTDDVTQIFTTDSLIENVHFHLDTVSWEDLGWKALAVNLSDIAAMGGMPQYAIVALGLPQDTEVDCVARMYEGMAAIARKHHLVVVGGDTTSAPVVMISVSLLGKALPDLSYPDNLLTRSAAHPGQCIAVTGYLGASGGGLRLLSRGIRPEEKAAWVLAKAHNHPTPRIMEGQILVRNGVRAAMDLSDGLMADLPRLCQASETGARIRMDWLPVHPTLKDLMVEESLELALTGGEDYELLFAADEETINKVKALLTCPVTVIGEMVEDTPGKVTLVDETGKTLPWDKGGWEHFRAKATK